MSKSAQPDLALLKLPSLRTIKTFLIAARHQNFTRAAETLCISQAAVSRQIRELEEALGSELFVRNGRSIELTDAGSILFDAVQLSFGNIYRATERIRDRDASKNSVTLCCSPSFSRLWLVPRIQAFLKDNPDIDLNIVATHNVFALEPGTQPDIFVSKWRSIQEGYSSRALFCDVVYPVCSPQYLADNPQVRSLEGIRDAYLLSLTPHGRSQVSEHIDWNLWLTYQNLDWRARDAGAGQFLANDYSTLVELARQHQGVALGYGFLVESLLDSGQLVRPVAQSMVLEDTLNYLAIRDEKNTDERCSRVHQWLIEQFSAMKQPQDYR